MSISKAIKRGGFGLLVLLSLSLHLSLQAQDEALKRLSLIKELLLPVSFNPLLHAEYQPSAYTILRTSYRDDRRLKPETLGKRHVTIRSSVEGFRPLDKGSAVGGEIRYEHSLIKKQIFNDTNDYDRLYPYILSDAKGGDLTLRTYLLQGYYLGKNPYFSWAIQGDYHAETGYRQTDPRPLNVSNTLQSSLALGKSVGSYLYLFRCSLGRYKQDNNLAFYNENRRIALYTEEGMGSEVKRFTGDKSHFVYQGYDCACSLALKSKDQATFYPSIGLDFIYSKTERMLFQINSLPLDYIYRQKWMLFFSQKCLQTSALDFYLLGKMKLSLRKGVQNRFGKNKGISYPILFQEETFHETEGDGSLSLYALSRAYNLNAEVRGQSSLALRSSFSLLREELALFDRYAGAKKWGIALDYEQQIRWRHYRFMGQVAYASFFRRGLSYAITEEKESLLLKAYRRNFHLRTQGYQLLETSLSMMLHYQKFSLLHHLQADMSILKHNQLLPSFSYALSLIF